MAKSEEELKSLMMKAKEKSEKVDWTQHSENQDHGIQSHDIATTVNGMAVP